MDKEPRAPQLLSQFQSLHTRIQAYQKSQEQIRQILEILYRHLTEHNLSIILYLYHKQSLLRLIEQTKDIYRKNKQKGILKTVYLIFELSCHCFLDYDEKYKKVFFSFKTSFLEKCKLQQCLGGKVFEKYAKMAGILNKYMKIKHSEQELYAKGEDLMVFIKEIKTMQPDSLSDQVIVHWLKKDANQLQRSIAKDKHYPQFGLCCNTTFFQSRQSMQIEHQNNQYALTPKWKSIHDDKATLFSEFVFEDIALLRRKTIQFLNTIGGFIYFGVEKDRVIKKKGRMEGMALTRADRTNFLKTIFKEFVYKVYPSEGEDIDKSEKEEKDRLQLYKSDMFKKLSNSESNLVQITPKVQVQFVTMHDCNLFTARNQRGVEMVIVRVKICAGDPAEVYFTEGDRHLPLAYTSAREALTMLQFTTLIQKRQKDKFDEKIERAKALTHYLCIHTLDFVEAADKESDEEDERFKYQE